ncbi:MAG: type II toxin-antitoxin system VapC family toxin, partial [Planctomycetota bacterium]
LLLDTSTLLWLAAEPDRLSPRARTLLARHAGGLFVSAITGFEIGALHRKRALTLPLAPEAWYAAVLEFHGVSEIEVTGRIAAASTGLPPLGGDICDRIIVATARRHALTVLTPDPLIEAYPDVETAW